VEERGQGRPSELSNVSGAAKSVEKCSLPVGFLPFLSSDAEAAQIIQKNSKKV
jgi:hypothetical protein